MLRPLKRFVRRRLTNLFHLGQRLGVDVLPRHFYSEIPDIRRLKATDDWRRPLRMPAVANDLDAQLAWLRGIAEVGLEDRRIHDDACRTNNEFGYGPVEAIVLDAVVRKLRPTSIVQVGCGVSTALCLSAAERVGHTPRVACIEPYPSDYLRRMDREGRITLHAVPVQAMAAQQVADLLTGERPFLFIDSTHTLGPGGEVTRLIVDLLPLVPVGTLVHFHDIWFPYDYTPDVLDSIWWWHETALMMAFLSFNDRFRILCSQSDLHHQRPDDLRAIIPDYRPRRSADGNIQVGEGDYPASLYLERVS